MVSTARNMYPFTPSQWQELEHQALIFKYMVSGMPIPPDLLFTIRRSFDSSLSSKLILHQPHVGWNCFQMGFGKKIDPEPGRCRRTDGKKWRCSKEAYPDSKYCERHMHRGRNRSRKPVEVLTTDSTIPISISSSITKIPNPSSNSTSHSLSSLSSITSEEPHLRHNHHSYNTHLHHPFRSPTYSSSSRPPVMGLFSQDNTSHFGLECGPYSHVNRDYRTNYGYGMKEEVDEYAFFSEASGTMRSLSDSSMDESWRLTPLTMGSSSLNHLKQRPCFGLQSEMAPLKLERDDEPQKVMHHFFDEWPLKSKDSWLESEDKLSNNVPVSKTQLSISIPNCSHDFFMAHDDK